MATVDAGLVSSSLGLKEGDAKRRMEVHARRARGEQQPASTPDEVMAFFKSTGARVRRA